MICARMSLGIVLLAPAALTAAAEPPPLMLGVAWYPEQWPEERWQRGLELMQAAGIRMVRIGEFAWSSLEPEEGRFALDWLERAVDQAAAHGMHVVLGTPSDAPPAWLTSTYPDTLRIDESGRRLQHGMRRQFSYASTRYRILCRRVVEQMARRFGHHPAVIGWQIGNEYTDDSFDADARQRYHEWLRARYGTLEALNQRWNTAYWSQSYSTWEQIPMVSERANPGLLLDYKRFVTSQWREFQRNQLDALRAQVDRRQFVTTNLGGLGWAARFNRHEIAADLDLISWDEYVGQGHVEPYRLGATHDLVRGWKRRNFWVMETQPGFVDWASVSNALDRGETRAMVWQAVGHGADCVAFWQWRAGLNGQEQYHGVLVGADGEPVPLYEEARQIGAEFARAASTLAATAPVSEVALLHDYDSRWAIDIHKQTQRYDQIEILLGYYRPLRDLAQSVDIVDPRTPLDDYKLVVAPSLNVISEELARHLLAYVERGGHLVLGPRSGMKDEFNALVRERQPGPLAAPLGGRVEQFYALLEDVPLAGAWGEGRATVWAEHLGVRGQDVEVLLRYGAGNGWLDGQAAVITRRIGRGSLTYVGAVMDAPLMRKAARWMLERARVALPSLRLPEGVELSRRVGAGREVYVLVNHTPLPSVVALPAAMRDVLRGQPVREVTLAARDVAVLTRDRVSGSSD